MDESASMLCARVMRGMSSTENDVTPVAAISSRAFARPERPQKSDQDLPAAQQRQVSPASTIIGAIRQHLDDDVSGAEDISAAGQNLRPLVGVVGVGIAGLHAGSGLHRHFHT